MRKNGIIGIDRDLSEAVSEIIGVVLMISLVVIGIGMVSVIIIGQDTPVELPSLSMIPGTYESDLYLYHTGGDSLKRGEFYVRVDGVDYYADDLNIMDQDGTSNGGWESWGLGQSLKIVGKSDYSQILIISTRGGQGSIITGSGDYTVTPTTTGTGTPTSTVTSTPTSTVTATPTSTPAPVADFTSDVTSGVAPLEVSFTDLSTGGEPTSWVWIFGDGLTSTDPNPTHTYSGVGTYDVTLVVSNDGGSSQKTVEDMITVNTPSTPVADFSATPRNGYEPMEVSFTDLSTNGPASWSWNFGDGSTSALQNPSHNYTSDGIYTVSLTATNAGGGDTETKEGYITVLDSGSFLEDIDFSADPLDGLAPLTVSFTDQSTGIFMILPHSYYWEFGDGSTSTDQNPVHTYTAPGTYTVKMTVNIFLFGEYYKEKIDYVTVGAVPVADFSGSPREVVKKNPVTFTDDSTGTPTSWEWDFGDGITNTVQNPTHVYKSRGTYDVSLTVSNAYGTDSITEVGYITVTNN